ncbi:hypothetical protein, partial [Acinetobacter baumannii]|uniref:hypothetical protein n=1 Tax=Acinetobacter baumannii TaxID=470 RepID=UPI002FD7C236
MDKADQFLDMGADAQVSTFSDGAYAMYVVRNKDYAKYVIALALEAEDDELKRCVERLMVLTDSIPEQSQKEMTVSIQTSEESEITAEDIYRAQVPHHYIGALR